MHDAMFFLGLGLVFDSLNDTRMLKFGSSSRNQDKTTIESDQQWTVCGCGNSFEIDAAKLQTVSI